jgi:alkanesulfonate monooxygenase SsuD/methylene tetrahydromethanopterin reductase-like flavin-dependent oxidoreductase (luciferase family)
MIPDASEAFHVYALEWTRDRLEFFVDEKKYFTYENVRLAPKSLQQPWPEIRVAAASPDTYVEVAELGHPIFVAARTGNISELAPLVKTYREAWKKAGHPGEGEVYLRVPVYVADSDEKARRPREHHAALHRRSAGRLGSRQCARHENRARGAKMQARLRGAARTHDRGRLVASSRPPRAVRGELGLKASPG